MNRFAFPTLLILTAFFSFCSSINGDIVSWAATGSVHSQIDAIVETDSGTGVTSSISKQVSQNNSFTSTTHSWAWDGGARCLDASATLTAEKTTTPKSGADHVAMVDFQFTFAIDSSMQLELDGLWGFENVAGTNDNLNISLSDGSTTLFSTSTTSNTGLTSDSFSYSNVLGPGTYTFTFDGDLIETIPNQGTTQGGWQLSNFKISDIGAVPEPSSSIPLIMIAIGMFSRRKRITP